MQVFPVSFENCEEDVTSLHDDGCVTIDAWPHEKTGFMWKICDSLQCFIDVNEREPWQSLLEKLLFFLDDLQSPPATKKTKNNLQSRWALCSLTVIWDNSRYGTLSVLYCAPSQTSPLFPLKALPRFPGKESHQASPPSSPLTPLPPYSSLPN